MAATDTDTSTDSLGPLLEPTSIAIIGASNDPTRIGGRPLLYTRDAGFAGPIYPVNPNRDSVQGLPSFASIGEERGEDVLISLFADHITEVDSINRHLQTIHTKEAANITADSNLQAGLMLVSSVLELLVSTVDDLKKNIDETTVDDLKKIIEATIDN